MKQLLLFLFVSTLSFSQTLYKGNVSDEFGPIPGVTICVKNSSRCTYSDLDGNYQIQVKKGDELVLSYSGMKTRTIIVNDFGGPKSGEIVNPITSDDYAQKVKKSIDSSGISKSSGDFDSKLFYNIENSNITKISRKQNQIYQFKNLNDHHKLFLEFNQEYIFSSPIRLPKYQKQYAQGRSQNGDLVYQSPETNEIFSFGPNVNSLQYSANNSEFYPQGDIINQSSGNANPLKIYDSNNFLENTRDNKYFISATVLSPKGNYFKANFNYKTGTISIPTSRNNEITTAIKYFRNVSQHSKIETLITYNDFENNLSNSNFGVNKIIFANAVTPIHFDNSFATTLSNDTQRSFSSLENNSYYLIHNNLDKNKSKTISANFNHFYTKNSNSNTANLSFQSSEITNANGQNPFFAGIFAPNFNERIEKFKSFSASDIFKHNFDDFILESKIDFRFQERRLERNYFDEFPFNTVQNKLDIFQKRFEVFYNLNGSYTINDAFLNDESVIFKVNSDVNYSSTVKNNLMSNFLASAEIRNLFIRNLSVLIEASFNQVEPSLQNNNLNFNSLRYNLSQFKQLKNSLELITLKNAVHTNEATTNLGLMYNLNYNWNFKANYYYKSVENLYAPIFISNTANWSPDVDYSQNGFEFEIEKNFKNYKKFDYAFNLNFSMYRNEITRLRNNQNRIAFAGFSDINKNYIVGQPLGVIVGSSYSRDSDQNVVIDEQGFPMEDLQPKVLGDPNPDFVIGFSNTFKYKKLALNLAFDWSQGGEIWNGTQQTLNYYGKSELSANQRNITDFLFNGVTQSGVANTQAVSFYDANLPVQQNRWTRYGIDGVAENAIEDATYFRLNSVNLSYSSEFGNSDIKKSFSVSFFVNNVFIISKSKSAFSNNSMFNSLETSGLDYFNTPMMRSFGTSLTVKF